MSDPFIDAGQVMQAYGAARGRAEALAAGRPDLRPVLHELLFEIAASADPLAARIAEGSDPAEVQRLASIVSAQLAGLNVILDQQSG